MGAFDIAYLVIKGGLQRGVVRGYDVLMTTSGNRSELFGEDVYGVAGGEYTG